MSDASAILWQAAEELNTAPTMFGTMTPTARAYIQSWLRTVDTGCGHDAPVLFTAMPMHSTVCPVCVETVGLRTHTARCGLCLGPIGDDGTVTAFALDARIIVFASMCAACLRKVQP